MLELTSKQLDQPLQQRAERGKGLQAPYAECNTALKAVLQNATGQYQLVHCNETLVKAEWTDGVDAMA
jgi:hypothetical protein